MSPTVWVPAPVPSLRHSSRSPPAFRNRKKSRSPCTCGTPALRPAGIPSSRARGTTRTPSGATAWVEGEYVAGNFFADLGVPMAIGRRLTHDAGGLTEAQHQLSHYGNGTAGQAQFVKGLVWQTQQFAGLLLEIETTILSLITSWLELSSEEGLYPAFDLSTAKKRTSITDPALLIFMFNIVLDFLIKNNADPKVWICISGLHRSIGVRKLKMISGGTVVKAFHYRNL